MSLRLYSDDICFYLFDYLFLYMFYPFRGFKFKEMKKKKKKKMKKPNGIEKWYETTKKIEQ